MKDKTERAKKSAADLHALSRRGLRNLSFFLLISTAFFCVRGVDFLAPLGEGFRALLGAAPSAGLVSAAVAGYTLSALILIIGRTAAAEGPSITWQHLFFRCVFYPFYIFAGALESHFMGVFVAGLLLYALEQLNVWSYAQKNLPGEGIFGRS